MDFLTAGTVTKEVIPEPLRFRDLHPKEMFVPEVTEWEVEVTRWGVEPMMRVTGNVGCNAVELRTGQMTTVGPDAQVLRAQFLERPTIEILPQEFKGVK